MEQYGEQVKKDFYVLLEIARNHPHDFEELQGRLVSILYDIVDIDLFRDITNDLLECIETIDQEKTSKILNKFTTILSVCPPEAFRPICKELFDIVNRVRRSCKSTSDKSLKMEQLGIRKIK